MINITEPDVDDIGRDFQSLNAARQAYEGSD